MQIGFHKHQSSHYGVEPDIDVGLASIPAPIAVPAMIIDPPKRDGSFFEVIFCYLIIHYLLLIIHYLFKGWDNPHLYSYLGYYIDKSKENNKVNHSFSSIHFIRRLRKLLTAGLHQ